jgi:hypothetical protein
VTIIFFFSFRRQDSQCLDDIVEVGQPRFTNCNHVLELLSDGSNITRSDVATYCQAHCSSYIISFYDKLARDCDFPDQLVCTTQGRGLFGGRESFLEFLKCA